MESSTTTNNHAALVKVSSDLPHGWYEGFDQTFQRKYYFEKRTRRSTWTKPMFEEEAAAAVTTEQDTKKTTTTLAQQHSDWIEVYSPEHSRNYYYNKVTKQSVWTDPRGFNIMPVPNRVVLTKVATIPSLLKKNDMVVGDTTTLTTMESVKLEEMKKQLEKEKEEIQKAWDAVINKAKELKLSITASEQQAVGDGTTSPQRIRRGSLADDLESFTRDLERRGAAIKLFSSPNDDNGIEGVIQQAEELNRAARQFSTTKSDKSAFSAETTALMIFGDAPSKEDVERNLKQVKGQMKYAQDEVKAHDSARKEARKVEDLQGGYYNALGVPRDATKEELKKAFHKSMIQWHPDKVKPEDRARAEEVTNVIKHAYACLSDPWEREIYDWFGLEQYLTHLKVIQCFKNYMYTGLDIIKHPRKGSPRRRTIWLSPDNTMINTYHERVLEIPNDKIRERIKGVVISDVFEVRRGIQTQVFERTGRQKKKNLYFSLVSEARTLDIEAESPEVADFLATRLTLLIIDLKRDMRWMRRYYELKAKANKDAANHAAASSSSEDKD